VAASFLDFDQGEIGRRFENSRDIVTVRGGVASSSSFIVLRTETSGLSSRPELPSVAGGNQFASPARAETVREIGALAWKRSTAASRPTFKASGHHLKGGL
jgi:hypothetical protein